MDAIAPGLPHTQEVVIAKDQPEYNPLPAAIVDRDEGVTIVTRWRFSDEERAAIVAGADLYLEVLTFGSALQPLRLYIGDEPDAN